MKGVENSAEKTEPSCSQTPEDPLILSQTRAKTKSDKQAVVSAPRRVRRVEEKTQAKNDEEKRAKEKETEGTQKDEQASKKDTVESPTKVTKVPEVPYIEVTPLAEVTRQDPPKPSTREGPAYKNVAPVEKTGLAEELVEKLLSASLSTTVGELLGIAPEVRKEIAKQVSKVRKTERAKVSQQLSARIEDVAESEEEDDDEPENVGTAVPSTGSDLNRIRVEELPVATYTILTEDSDIGPKGAVVWTDPVVQYLESLPPDKRKMPIIAARDIEGLRAIFPEINAAGAKESILDPGSQIVSMGKMTAAALGLSWDPDLVMCMEGCHGDVEATLGLARNVRFDVGDVTLILQVHVVNKAPYEVLLGRPFDVLGRTIVNNDSDDGAQTITITDPTSGKKTTFPTFERGKAPSGTNQGRNQSFQTSRS